MSVEEEKKIFFVNKSPQHIIIILLSWCLKHPRSRLVELYYQVFVVFVCSCLWQIFLHYFHGGTIFQFILVEKRLFTSSFSVFTGALTQSRYGDLPCTD